MGMTCRMAAALTRKWGGSWRADSMTVARCSGIGEVHDQRLAAGLADRLQPLVVDVHAGHPGALAQQVQGERLADAAAGAGDDGPASLEAHAVGPSAVPPVGAAAPVGAAPGCPGWMTGRGGLVRPMRSYSRSGMASSDFHTLHWHLRFVAGSSGPAPQRRIDGPDRVTPAFGRDGREGQVAVGAVVAHAGLAPGPRPGLLDDPELVRGEDPRAGPLLGVAAQDAAAGRARIEADDPAVVLLDELDVAAPAGPDQVAAHGLQADVQVAVERLLVRRRAHVEGHVALLEVGLHDRPVAGLELGLAEALDHEGQDAGHQVGRAVVEHPPVLAHAIELLDGGGDRQVVAADAVGQAPGPQAHGVPARFALQGPAVGIGHQLVEPGHLGVQVLAGHALLDEPVLEAGRPHLVDDVDDLGLFHEVVDELGGVLAAIGGQAELVTGRAQLLLDLDHGRDGLVGPVPTPDALADRVRPLQVGDHAHSSWGPARMVTGNVVTAGVPERRSQPPGVSRCARSADLPGARPRPVIVAGLRPDRRRQATAPRPRWLR